MAKTTEFEGGMTLVSYIEEDGTNIYSAWVNDDALVLLGKLEVDLNCNYEKQGDHHYIVRLD